jgi:hypothetical protein
MGCLAPGEKKNNNMATSPEEMRDIKLVDDKGYSST